MPYRDSPHHEIELVMNFIYLNSFKPNEHKEDYHKRELNDEKFLFEFEDKKNNTFVGEKVFTFETNDIIVKICLDLDFNNIKFS